MTASVCFVISDVFPFASGEEFLENEIGHLAAAFERVIVVATKVAAGATQTRAVPDNVTVLKAGRPVAGARSLPAFALAGLRGVGVAEISGASFHPGKVALEAIFEGRARVAMAELRPQLIQRAAELGLTRGAEVVLYSYWLHVGARVAMLLAEQLRAAGVTVTKMVSRAHRFDLYAELSPLKHLPQRRRLIEAFDGIHPVADSGTALLQAAFPGQADKISTRRLGTLDPGELVPVSQDPFRVVSCAFLVPRKRVDRTPAILAGVQASDVDVRWTHLGPGETQDQLQAECDQVLSPGKAELLGYVPNADVPATYRRVQASVLLSLSTSEGVPVTMMEASSLGLPVVATDVGGVAEVVRDGVNGRLLPADFTDEEVTAILTDLARLPAEDFQAMGRRGREIWEAEFNADVVYAAWAAELAAD